MSITSMRPLTLPTTTTLDRELRKAIARYHNTLHGDDLLAAARLAAHVGEGDCQLDLEYMLNVVHSCRASRNTTLLQRHIYQTVMSWAYDTTDQDLAFVDLIATLDEIDPDRQACSTRTQPRSGLLAVAHGVYDIARFAWSHPRLVGSVCTIASAATAVTSYKVARRKAREPREVEVRVKVLVP